MGTLNKKFLLAILFVLFVAILFATFTTGVHRNRLEVVREKGSVVMPFNLNSSHHYFQNTASGGKMYINSINGDLKEVKLIRGHLYKISLDFEKGDYGDPSDIHGSSMSGLAVLKKDYKNIDIRYKDTTLGGEINFNTVVPEDIKAIQDWFKAQVNDHGSDASFVNDTAHNEDTSMDSMITTKAMWEFHHPGETVPDRLKDK